MDVAANSIIIHRTDSPQTLDCEGSHDFLALDENEGVGSEAGSWSGHGDSFVVVSVRMYSNGWERIASTNFYLVLRLLLPS